MVQGFLIKPTFPIFSPLPPPPTKELISEAVARSKREEGLGLLCQSGKLEGEEDRRSKEAGRGAGSSGKEGKQGEKSLRATVKTERRKQRP